MVHVLYSKFTLTNKIEIMIWKEQLKTKVNRSFKVIPDVMENIAWHLMTQIVVTHRVFLLIIMRVVARVKHGIRRRPGHRPCYYIIQPCAGQLHNKIVN